jgi:hypothetical protein
MATAESTGTSSEIKEQYKEHEKGLLGGVFLFSPSPKEKQR